MNSTPTPMCKKVLSFVMPAWKAEWLPQAIESILGQTYQDIELIVVDDCSPEDLKAVVDRYQDPRLSYHRNQKNLGGIHLTHQWLHSVNLAHGEYVVIAADDDVYDPRFAESCMDMAQRYPEVDIIRAGVVDVDEEGQMLWQEDLSPLSAERISQIEYTYAYRQGIVSICMGNLVFRREELLRKGFRDFPRALGSDIAVSIELAEHGMALAEAGLFSFRHSTVHLSGSLTQLEPKLEAINQFFEWVTVYSLVDEGTERDRTLRQAMTKEGWREKYIYDCFNHVVKHVPSIEFPAYLARVRYAGAWDKCMMFLRYLKRKVQRA